MESLKKSLSVNKFALLAACGLGINLVWCTLMGHTMGFLSSATGLDDVVNPRLFFLFGILVFSLMYLGVPNLFTRVDSILRYTFPLLAAFGTACFGLAYHQGVFEPAILAVGGLAVAGAGYFWLVSRYILMLARTQGFFCTIACVAGGLMVKLPLLFLLSAFADASTQVALAIAAPIVSAILFEVSCSWARKKALAQRLATIPEGKFSALMSKSSAEIASNDTLLSSSAIYGVPVRIPNHPLSSSVDSRVVYLLIATAAVVLAVIRSVSYLGMWGDTNANISASLPWLTGIIVPAACVALFAYGVLFRMADVALLLRFQPAFLLILTGLFVVAIQANPSVSSVMFLTDVIQIDELFAHLLFWAVVVVALERIDASSYRVLGFAGTVYAFASIAWVVLLGRAAIVDTLLVMMATYALVVVSLCVMWALSRRKGDSLIGLHSSQVSEEVDVSSGVPSSSESPLIDTVLHTCSEMAQQYGLSPRETEVFVLLAQGRTRAFIQQELVLSGSTVKTHVSHIYVKMGVHDRQEMMNLIWS